MIEAIKKDLAMTYEEREEFLASVAKKYFPTKTEQDTKYVAHILLCLYLGVLFGVMFGIPAGIVQVIMQVLL